MEIALEQLPIEERISLAQKIWDSVVTDWAEQQNVQANVPAVFSQEQQQSINERLAEYRKNGESGIDFNSVLKDFEKIYTAKNNSIDNRTKWDEWFANSETVTDDFMNERIQPEQEREF